VNAAAPSSVSQNAWYLGAAEKGQPSLFPYERQFDESTNQGPHRIPGPSELNELPELARPVPRVWEAPLVLGAQVGVPSEGRLGCGLIDVPQMERRRINND
jgi:hypothetical protein